MEVKLLRFTPDPLDLVETAASQCYQSDPSPDGRITKHCIRSGHTSVTEHVSFTWEISGVSRALLAQITRHRLASFSVQSQRYVPYDKGFEYITPPSIVALGEDAMAEYTHDMEYIADAYARWKQRGIPSEDARMVLPNACCTSMVVTMNLREFAHFCNERLCSRAQWEIRKLCKEMVRTVNEATHDSFKYFLVPKCEVYTGKSFCPESKKNTCGRHPRLEELIKRPTP